MNLDHYGKVLALVLRHKPEAADLIVDEYGYVFVEDLLKGITENFFPIDLELLEQIVAEDDKGRYAFNHDHTKIRAVQGHSFKVNLELVEKVPPKFLFHGTPLRNAHSIEVSGLSKMRRQYVHLTESLETAYSVGARYHDKVVICIIDAEQMYTDGSVFYQAENGVWLTDKVNSYYILQVELDSAEDISELKSYIKTLY